MKSKDEVARSEISRYENKEVYIWIKNEQLGENYLAMRSRINMWLLLILAATIQSVHAQFTLEHFYPADGYYPPNDFYNELFLIDFETLGEKFVIVDKTLLEVRIYSLQHILELTIDLSAAPDPTGQPMGRDVLYKSQHLWDLTLRS